eukprot:CAMPEP_0174886202 /NCGR_PEP_ID=MMETSP0167-20121228/1460_1 /TAXON_ID=38298 /ORGANISM="Rhodella maculata, Strain CCMP736" /LENGTH=976 /DNA_ID=CAMNT_0016122105 /DNA_START=26 /DNA_END=2956 /DNA_ORIENTATION=-
MNDASQSPPPEEDDPSTIQSVEVAVRMRPLNSREKERHDPNFLWRIESDSLAQELNGKVVPNTTFPFNHVFGQESQNMDIFESVAKRVVRAAVDGFNGVIFAYGQTSSGKTHTMIGTESEPGVTPLSINHVFALIGKKTERDFLMRASYVEIYNENIRDLLRADNENLKVHEDFTGRVFTDAHEEIVTSADEVLDLMRKGEMARTFGSTNMNDRSSRSHTIFTIVIESRLRVAGEHAAEDGVSVRASALSLVDLAGSERVASTGAEGVRLKEGGHINKSLLTLGTVINKLSEGSTGHIPYRDAKLTRILQPALGGNACTSVICAVTPASIHAEETVSTLNFASRAMKVTNHMQCNEILDDRAMLRKAQKEIENLKTLLLQTQSQNNSMTSIMGNHNMMKSSEAEKLTGKLGALENQIGALRKDKISLQERIKNSNDGKFASDATQYKLVLQKLGIEEENSSKITRLKRSASITGLQENIAGLYSGSDRQNLQKIQKMSLDIITLKKAVYDAEETLAREKKIIDFEREATNGELATLVTAAENAEKAAAAAREQFRAENRAKVEAEMQIIVRDRMAQACSLVERDAMNVELEKLKQSMKAESDAHNETKKMVSTLKKDLAEATRNNKSGTAPFLREIEQLKKKNAEIDVKLKTARQSISKLDTDKKQFEQSNRLLEREAKAAKSELQKILDTQAKLRVMKESVEVMQRIVEEAKSAQAEAQEKLEAAQIDKQILASQLSQRQTQIVDLTHEAEQTQARIENLEAKAKLLETTFSSLRAAESENADLSAQCGDLRGALERLRDESKENTQANASKVERLHMEKATFLKDHIKVMERVHKRDSRIAELEVQIERLKSSTGEAGVFLQKLKRREAELAAARRALSQAELAYTSEGRGAEFLERTRLATLEADVDSLRAVTKTQADKIRNLEEDRLNLIKEADLLRQALKVRDRARVAQEQKMNVMQMKLGGKAVLGCSDL